MTLTLQKCNYFLHFYKIKLTINSQFRIDYCSGEQCSPENLDPFLLLDIGHIKNGEQCSPLQKSFKEISLIKTNFNHNSSSFILNS